MTITQIKELLSQYQPSNTDKPITWTLPTDLEHGILTSNIAFVLAKELKQNPNLIAQNISDELNNWFNQSIIEKALEGNSPREGWQAKPDGVFVKEVSNPPRGIFRTSWRGSSLGDPDLHLPIAQDDKNIFDSNLITAKPIGAYINLIPTESFYTGLLDSNQLTNLVQTSDQKFILDYIAANVAKKLSIGNMRNCNIGDSIRRILQLKYPNLVTDNHWGDWGVNMGVLIWGWKVFDHSSFEADESMIDKLTKIYVWANAQKEIVEGWDNLVRQEFLKLEHKDETNYKLWLEFIQTTKQDLRLDLDLMGVPKHDIEQGESFYEADMNLLTAFMEKHKLWIADGKARYFDFETLAEKWVGITDELRKKVSSFGRCYLISSTGYTSYCYRDVATKLQYARDLGVDLALVVTDKTQKHNFDQAFSIICYLASLPEFVTEFGQDVADRIVWQNMCHLGYGFLKLESGKMSARKGNVILLRDLVSVVTAEAKKIILEKTPNSDLTTIDSKSHKIALAAIKWNDLKQSYEQDITFDINQVLNFVGNTGVYQLYTYARLNSVLRKLNSEKLKVKSEKSFESLIPDFGSNAIPLVRGGSEADGVFQSDATTNDDRVVAATNTLEQAILKQIWTLPEALESICGNYQIHLLTNHLYELSNLANKWYNDVPILKDPRQQFMQVFIIKIMKHLEFCLDLLGIEVVEEI
jgi:arginyl-tRNA synthetase